MKFRLRVYYKLGKKPRNLVVPVVPGWLLAASFFPAPNYLLLNLLVTFAFVFLLTIREAPNILFNPAESSIFAHTPELLRLLKEQSFHRLGAIKKIVNNAQIIDASNLRLEDAVGSGRFSQDLYHQLTVFSIKLLPLREHKEDIPILLQYF